MSSLISRRSLGIASAALLASRALPAVAADAYPSRPVRIVVPYGAGGIADVTMRLAAQKMSEKLGQQFIIDNRPGAGGVVGVKAVTSSPPDGYTLSMIGGGLTIAKAQFKTLPYDLEADLIPISTTAFYGLLMVTNATSPLKSAKDIIDTAKKTPGKLNFGSINPGSTQHLATELFRTLAKIDVTMVPYKTTPELVTALIRGDIDVAFDYDAGFRSAIEDKRIFAAGFTGPTRAPHMAEVPTIAESGLPGYEATSWNGLAAPTGTPADVIAILTKTVNEAVSQPDIKATTATFGMESRGSTPEELRARIKADVAKWSQVIESAGIEKR